MSLLQFTSYVIAASVCFTSALATYFCTRNIDRTRHRYAYVYNLYIGSCAVVFFYYVTLAIMVPMGYNFTFARAMLAPTMGFLAFGQIFYSILWTVHASQSRMRVHNSIILLAIAWIMLHPLVYAEWCFFYNLPVTFENYLLYTHSPLQRTLSVGMYLLTTTLTIAFVILVVNGYRRYRDVLVSYFADDLRTLRKRGLTLSSIMLVNIIIAVVNMAVYTTATLVATPLILAISLFGIGMYILMNSDSLRRIDIAFTYIKRKKVYLPSNEQDDEQLQSPDIEQIAYLLREWASRNDKPWNRKGLTIADVAQESGIRLTVLLEYLHFVLGMSFRNWINSLRQKK